MISSCSISKTVSQSSQNASVLIAEQSREKAEGKEPVPIDHPHFIISSKGETPETKSIYTAKDKEVLSISNHELRSKSANYSLPYVHPERKVIRLGNIHNGIPELDGIIGTLIFLLILGLSIWLAVLLFHLGGILFFALGIISLVIGLLVSFIFVLAYVWYADDHRQKRTIQRRSNPIGFANLNGTGEEAFHPARNNVGEIPIYVWVIAIIIFLTLFALAIWLGVYLFHLGGIFHIVLGIVSIIFGGWMAIVFASVFIYVLGDIH